MSEAARGGDALHLRERRAPLAGAGMGGHGTEAARSRRAGGGAQGGGAAGGQGEMVQDR